MNLLQQLMAANIQGAVKVVSPKRRSNHVPDHLRASNARHSKAVIRYREAMGSEWHSTRAIEIKMGMAAASARGTLIYLMGKGLVERRPVGDPHYFNRKKGYEWRFKDCSPSTAAR